jgi:hypothetical protein
MKKLRETAMDFWREVGPFFRHGLSITCVVLIAAGIIKVLGLFLAPETARSLDEIDIYLVKALFWLFGGYTFLIIANRLLHYSWRELANTWRKQPQRKQETLIGSVNESASRGLR